MSGVGRMLGVALFCRGSSWSAKCLGDLARFKLPFNYFDLFLLLDFYWVRFGRPWVMPFWPATERVTRLGPSGCSRVAPV